MDNNYNEGPSITLHYVRTENCIYTRVYLQHIFMKIPVTFFYVRRLIVNIQWNVQNKELI